MRFSPSFKNWVSLAGAAILLVSFSMILFLLTVTTLSGRGGAYLGLLIYVLLPSVLLAGLVLIFLGMFLKKRRDLKVGVSDETGWPTVDLNDRRHRKALLIVAICGTVFLFASTISTFHAYEYSESIAFCGSLCHVPMGQEKIAHGNSPHANVRCIECHVGPGVEWYVRSKFNGLHELYGLVTDSFNRPIPTPLDRLRPARAICEQCHWPGKSFAQLYRLRNHYLQDDENSRWNIGMAVKVGAQEEGAGYQAGIHKHINPEVKIEYLAADDKRAEIPWIRYTNLDTGDVKIFQDADSPLEQSIIDSSQPRVMDCLDCHNRPSHQYHSPSTFLDQAFATGDLADDLPKLKATAVQLCVQEYQTKEEALEAIRTGLTKLYRESYPDIYTKRLVEVEKAITVVQTEYTRNFSPEMNASWKDYPDHRGHLESNGCFRCHSGRHTDETGQSIPNGCNLCHFIVRQGPPDDQEVAKATEALEFKHPVDIGEEWKEVACAECHQEASP